MEIRRSGNEPQIQSRDVQETEHVHEPQVETKQTEPLEVERPARSSSGGSSQAAESLLGAQAQQSQLQRQLLESRADAIHQACAGLGTDEAAVFRNLSGLSSEDRKQLDEIYKQKFGMSLEAQIRDEMSGPELDKGLALLRGGKQPQELEHRERFNEEPVFNESREEQIPE